MKTREREQIIEKTILSQSLSVTKLKIGGILLVHLHRYSSYTTLSTHFYANCGIPNKYSKKFLQNCGKTHPKSENLIEK